LVCSFLPYRTYRRKGVMDYVASVKLKPNESQEQLLRRFRKRVTNAGILSTVVSRRRRPFAARAAVSVKPCSVSVQWTPVY
jgi:hypothetical protein